MYSKERADAAVVAASADVALQQELAAEAVAELTTTQPARKLTRNNTHPEALARALLQQGDVVATSSATAGGGSTPRCSSNRVWGTPRPEQRAEPHGVEPAPAEGSKESVGSQTEFAGSPTRVRAPEPRATTCRRQRRAGAAPGWPAAAGVPRGAQCPPARTRRAQPSAEELRTPAQKRDWFESRSPRNAQSDDSSFAHPHTLNHHLYESPQFKKGRPGARSPARALRLR